MSATDQTLEALAEASAVQFGTSGVRGRVSDLSPDICRAYTQAFLKITGRSGGPLLVGRDLRPSSMAIACACASEALSQGFSPINAGVLPTPALAYATETRSLPGIMVTGSHIPFDRNGLKFYLPSGEISKTDEQRILACAIKLAPGAPAALSPVDTGILSHYKARYTSVFGPESLGGLKIGVYEHSSAARDLIHDVLQSLGATTLGLGRSDTFVPIDTEAVREEDRALGREWARSNGLDAIVTTDGDADRPLIADETGEWLRGDLVGILCAQALQAATVVTPVSSNTALEACGSFGHTIRTRIGSPHVIAAMEAATFAPVVGYEANGGFLLGTDVQINRRTLKALRTRDALLPFILVLATAKAGRRKLSELVAHLPRRHTFSDRLQNVDVQACRALLVRLEREPASFHDLCPPGLGPAVALDTTDGVRAIFTNGDILHLRLSGNAPELRCYTECSSPERANMLCRTCLVACSSILGIHG